jgi:DNA-binding CsgD family transcriptional regulator
VQTHLADVQRKLAVRNRVEIGARAWRTGVCRDEPG